MSVNNFMMSSSNPQTITDPLSFYLIDLSP